jgi:hypothetical protein
MKHIIKKIPIIRPIAHSIYRRRNNLKKPFAGSENYWIERYITGGNSGDGSYRKLAEFKAEMINKFVTQKNIKTIIEYGCGDGNQLKLAEYPSYTGFDVSPKALSVCREAFLNDVTKTFKMTDNYSSETAELTLSLDVIYHLIEDTVYSNYMNRLFDSSHKFVIIYASDTNVNPEAQAAHIKHRNFTKWVGSMKPEWSLLRHIPNRYPFNGGTGNSSFADFFIYERT